MLTNSTRNLGLFALSGFAFALAGCGDGPICPSELVLVIQSPSEGGNVTSANDQDPDTAGIQGLVSIRSNLKSGDDLVLTVEDGRTGAVAQYNTTVDGDGDASFAAVTLPGGPVVLSVEGSSDCGTASDEVSINVVTDGLCDLTIDQTALDVPFFAPIPVLNGSNDGNPGVPNFQADFSVQAGPGFEVELFVLDIEANSEASVDTVTADADGIAAFSTTLAQGRQVIRATCALAGVNEASAPSTFFVDTVAPTCSVDTPEAGVTVTPDFDEDGNDLNGIQMTWEGSVNDAGEDDVEGEAASFFRDTTEFVASAVAANGTSSTALSEFTSPGSFEVRFETQDHAANACIGTVTTDVIMDGCAITIDQPSALVTTDSDANGVNGLQSNFTVTVDTDCAGRTVFVNCGQGESSATAPGNGITTVPNVTLSANANSENSATCTARVVNGANFQTSADRLVTWDTLAPGGTLDFVAPAGLSCGSTVLREVGNDADGNLANGFQIRARVIAPTATTRTITVANATCTPTACEFAAPAAGGTVLVDLDRGNNDVRAVTTDTAGNQATTAACNVRLEDIAVEIVDPVGTGVLGAADGTVNGSDLEVTVCATSSLATVTMSLDVDGTSTTPMPFNGGLSQFCTAAPVSLSEGNHSLTATATEIAGTRIGSDQVAVSVDLTPPASPTGLTANSPNRQAIDMSWAAVAGIDSYVVKFNTTAFTNFATEGTVVVGVGTQTSTTINTLDAGTTYFVGVAARDANGNLSAAATLGPIVPELDASGAIAPPDLATASAFPRRYGQAFVSGDFNGDTFADVAISAPFKTVGANNAQGEVYIHFGSATGISATPNVTIVGPGPFTTFGYSMTRLNWTAGTTDGLAISAPFANSVFIFHGTTLSAGTSNLSTANADINIVVSGTANWFTSSFLGWSLASGELNSAVSREDLIIGAPSGGGVGGAVIINGGTLTGSTITLSDTADGTAMAGLEGRIFQNPVAAANSKGLGNTVAYLGDMRSGNGVGDIGIGYSVDDAPDITEDNAMYVLRGRTPTGTAGMTFTTLGANDLHVINPTADGTNGFGMQFGSIEDVSGDGFRDLVVSGHREGNGRVWIVRGSDTGTTTLTSTADYITRITGAAPGSPLFGTGIANNAIIDTPDINGDGVEDLVISGGVDGATTFPGIFVWYGNNIPTGDVSSTSAAYVIAGPDEFRNANQANQPNMLQIDWAGDVDGDGRMDLFWADWAAGVATEAEGRGEFLRDL